MRYESPAGAGAARAQAVPLIERIAEGQQDALAQLYDETSSMINGLLLRMLERREDAEEVLLDVYMKAWKYASSYSAERGSVQAWLVTMARNAAIDRIRQRRAQPKVFTFEPETTPEPVSGESSPEEQMSQHERRRRVQQVLNELPPEQREALMLAFFGGLTHAELAEKLGEPLGTIKSRIRMGLIRLRGLLEEPAQ
ncbi:MAG: polymerase, sigma-24 subunit, subfamily [Candidatus Solibacter sp.]|jgi:RNA polymerase sigma-70 factor (ECF subfamily)|nr:polymerase, sigma-24 subunit, subfamily [Candidatus Solibacter sp.]